MCSFLRLRELFVRYKSCFEGRTNFRATQTVVSINFDACNETGVDKEIVVNDANTFKALLFVLHVT